MKVLVVDDERLARGRVIRMLERIAGVVVAGEAESGAAALAQIEKLAPDVVLLDVDMPGMDGLSLAEKPDLPPIIFTTAHVQFASDAFDLDAVDYLVKPIRQERLEQALGKLSRRLASATPQAGATAAPSYRLAVHGPGTVRFVDARRVVVFRALDKYTEFTVDGEQLLVRESLDALEAQLAAFGFIRVHRAGLVRRDAITGLDHEDDALIVRLTDGTTAEVSRRHAAELRRLLGVRS